MDYYCYRLHTRDPLESTEIIEDGVTWGCHLYQQYCIDQWVKIEEERLNFQRYNQNN